MKKIQQWEAKDGAVFGSKKECITHEVTIALQADLCEELRRKDIVSSDEACFFVAKNINRFYARAQALEAEISRDA